ncbi:14441_t:CDS:10 [Funneliformis mosseae]|uniref:Kinesin-like protein n=1 Tax=Funneliformis mosseae TaxID=27381 RepID=A0A9N9ADR1_FUNMO|nr:14441_t:CDS:10 [Funneliformis mosseae]
MDISFSSEVCIERARKRRRSNDIKDGEKEINIQVIVRCRGRIDREIAANAPVIIETNFREVQLKSPDKVLKTYTFDRVFGPEADQAKIFDHIVIPILHEVKAGYNCTLFAYGQTSTGKTYTMEGNLDIANGQMNKHAGIIPRTLFNLFQDLEAEAQDFSVKNAADGIRVLKQGSVKRHAAQTNCNKNSRYHKKTMADGEDLLKVGKFNLVDLAGSECIGRSGAENNRAKEAGNINKSLLTLGRCINALNERCLHIPFRESKLTRLLQDSLGGKTKTCIIATVSPAKSCYDETMSTLDYAYRAKNIRNKPVANQRVTKKALIKDYINKIERLEMDLRATRDKNGIFMSAETHQFLVNENKSRKDECEELQKEKEMLVEKALIDHQHRKNLQELQTKFNDLKAMSMGFGSTVSRKINDAYKERTKEISEYHKYIDEQLDRFEQQKNMLEQIFTSDGNVVTTFFGEINKLRKGFQEAAIKKDQGLRKDSVTMLKSLHDELAGQSIKMQTYHAKIDEEISTLVTTTQEHIDSQNQAIIACQNITEEAAKTETRCLEEHNDLLDNAIKKECNIATNLNEELLDIIKKELNKFTNAQIDRLKETYDKGMKTSNTKYLSGHKSQYSSTKENLAYLIKESKVDLSANVNNITKGMSSHLDKYKSLIESTLTSLERLTVSANDESSELHKQLVELFKSFASDVTQCYSSLQNKMTKSQMELESSTLQLKENSNALTNF